MSETATYRVVLELEGPPEAIDEFLECLEPNLASNNVRVVIAEKERTS